jgi:hypothetical protein
MTVIRALRSQTGMVSQPSMQRIHRPLLHLSALALLFWLPAGCGQSEGGRCQITSDCASGLVCMENSSGNGRCRKPGSQGSGGSDAAAGGDVAEDRASPATPDVATVGAESGSEAVTPDIALPDSAQVDSAPVDSAMPDVSESEAGAAEAGGSEAGVSEAGALDTGEQGG